MDFGVLDCLLSLENNQNNLISWGDSDRKTKWVGSGVGFCTQDSSVSAIVAGTHEHNIPNSMLLQRHRSNGDHNMLSFSSPTEENSIKLPYYYRGYEDGGLFTASQRMELEHQALIYKYITANASIPSNLLIPIRKSLQTIDYSTGIYKQNTFGWGGLHLGLCNLPGSDSEPGRCRRTDGKKWRCAKDAVPDQKYCERHINRGRHRSRKLVEAQNCHSLRTNTAKLTSGSTIPCHTIPVSSSSSIPLKHTRVTEFGFIGDDSLVNPMHKSDAKAHHVINTFVHSSQPAISTAIELSCYGMGTGKQASRVPGGPLGEVLQCTSNGDRPTGANDKRDYNQ